MLDNECIPREVEKANGTIKKTSRPEGVPKKFGRIVCARRYWNMELNYYALTQALKP